MNTVPVTLAVAALVASAAASPYGRSGLFQDHNILGGGGDLSSREGSPLNPFPGYGEDVSAWMAATRSLVTPPEDPFKERPGSSLYDDYEPPRNLPEVLSRTLWFEEFPHDRAVLNWQDKRVQQGLPVYLLNSQRPGFPFYRGN